MMNVYYSWSDGSGGHVVDYWGDGQPDTANLGKLCVWQWANGTEGNPPDGRSPF